MDIFYFRNNSLTHRPPMLVLLLARISDVLISVMCSPLAHKTAYLLCCNNRTNLDNLVDRAFCKCHNRVATISACFLTLQSILVALFSPPLTPITRSVMRFSILSAFETEFVAKHFVFSLFCFESVKQGGYVK